jgi:hypothetical protein
MIGLIAIATSAKFLYTIFGFQSLLNDKTRRRDPTTPANDFATVPFHLAQGLPPPDLKVRTG